MTTALDLNARVWHTVKTAAEYADCHPQTVLKALRLGELKGAQRTANGRWRIHRDWLDSWLKAGA